MSDSQVRELPATVKRWQAQVLAVGMARKDDIHALLDGCGQSGHQSQQRTLLCPRVPRRAHLASKPPPPIHVGGLPPLFALRFM